MRRVFIPILVAVILLLFFNRWISFLDIQGLATIVAAVLSGVLTYCVMAFCGKRRLWLEVTLKEFQTQIDALAKETNAIKGHSIASISALVEIKKRSASYEKGVQSAIGAGTQTVLQSLTSLRDEVEGKTDLVKKTLSSLDDSLMKDMTGIVSRLDEVKGLSDLIPGMQERLVSDIGESARQTVDEIRRVQNGLAEVDKACCGISEQITKSAADLASAGNGAVSTKLDEIKGLSELIPGMQERIISEIGESKNYCFDKISALDESINNKIDSNSDDLFNRISDDVRKQAYDVKRSYDESVDVLEEDFFDYFKDRQEQLDKRESIDNAEIKILADIERLIKEDHQ